MNTLISHIKNKMMEMYKINNFPENVKINLLEGTKNYVTGKETHGDKTDKIKLTLYNNSKNK
jgi:hypothetical protein